MSRHDNCDHCSNAGKKVFGAAFAAAIGAIAGLLFAPKSGKQMRKDLAKQATTLKKNIQEKSSEIQEKVYSTFENAEDQLEKHYAELKAQVLAAIEQLDSKVKLTEKKYQAIVDEVIALYSEGKEWTKDMIDDLTKRLKKEWNKFNK